MIVEQSNLNPTEKGTRNALGTTDVETHKNGIVGIFTDTIRHKDGRVEVKEQQFNCIIQDIGKLIACLFKNQDGYVGLKYWAIGSGSDSWDVVNPPEATPTDTRCVNEIGRKEIPKDAIVFVDQDGTPTNNVTNSIKITLIFTENECNGVWREFALFGGNATTALNSGIAINHKNHSVMVKNDTMTIERQIRFIFN